MTIDASNYDSSLLGVSSYGSGKVYTRNASVPMGATIDEAVSLGDLVEDSTQLDATSALSRSNSQQFYKFSLQGNNLKLNFTPTTTATTGRVQILNSSGKVIADSSEFADADLQAAYAELTSSDGFTTKAGDYYVKVSYDVTAARSVDLSYSVALYSGEAFGTCYQTVAKPQTKSTQVLLTDQTMTYSAIDAQSYSTKSTHIANETISDAINIGWVAQNKTALSVSSRMTSVTTVHFYSFTLQQGDNLRFAFNNHTDTQDLRVQVMDSSGTKIYADSHGTAEQRAAYAALNSGSGMEAEAGDFVIKVSYAGSETPKEQVYDFKVYSGDAYDDLYTTTAATESLDDALYLGHWTTSYNAKDALATYLDTMFSGGDTNIFDAISTKI